MKWTRIGRETKYVIAAFGALFFCLFLLSYRFLNLWFTQDDTACIYGSTQEISRIFFDRDTYLLFNRTFYTPLLPVSFKVDFLLFGLNPMGYHFHNLILAFLTGIVGYRLFRLSLPRLESLIGAYLFLLSYPVITMVGWLSLRHYLWGMLFALLSLYLFKKHETRGGLSFSLTSCLFFTLAVLCKESFATIPAMFLVLGEGSALRRLRKSAPYFILAGLFFFLRWYMIGGLGGYIEAKVDMSAAHLAKRLIVYVASFSTSVWSLHAIFMVSLLLFSVISSVHGIARAIVLFLLAMFPFLFVEPMPIPLFTQFFPARFIVVQLMAAYAFSSILFRIKAMRFRWVGFLVVSAVLLLQIFHAQSTFKYNKQSSDNYKRLTEDILAKNSEKSSALLLHGDGIFYNFYYEAFQKLSGKYNDLGSVVTLSTPNDILLVTTDELKRADFLYVDGKWVDLTREKVPFSPPIINDGIAPPRLTMKQCGQFFTMNIAEDREGEIYAVLKTSLSERNIGIQAAYLPKKVNFKIGLARGKEIAYLFFCKKRECSRPIILSPGR